MRTLLFCFLTVLTTPALATDFHVLYLGGQSNMDGYGFTRDLPDELKQGVASVPLFHGNSEPDGVAANGYGEWGTVMPGHGVGFKASGQGVKRSDRFGVELSLAQTLVQAFPEKRFAFIKYSRGGTSIDQLASAAERFGCWEPDFQGGKGTGKGINQYDHFLATLNHAYAVSDIDGDGTADRLIPAGIIWMQGESDGNELEVAQRYQQNLKRLMDLVRAAFRTDDLPVVVGRIADSGQDADGVRWDYGKQVRKAQQDYADDDPKAAWVNTDGYGFSDPYHYNSAGYLDLGQKFANALIGLWDE